MQRCRMYDQAAMAKRHIFGLWLLADQLNNHIIERILSDVLIYKFVLVPTGASLTGLCIATLCLAYHQMWAEIFRHTCLQSYLQISSQTHKKSMFQDPRNFFDPLVRPWKPNLGGPWCFFSVILIFLWVRKLCKISEPYDRPVWEKSNNRWLTMGDKERNKQC